MRKRTRLSLGHWLFIALCFFSASILATLASQNFLSNGVATQGVVTGMRSVYCNKLATTRTRFTVRFTDQTGHVQTSSISQCADATFYAAPGDSVALVYLPDDPSQIALRDKLPKQEQSNEGFIALTGFITLPLLLLWIGKRILKSKNSEPFRPPEQIGATYAEYTRNSLFHD